MDITMHIDTLLERSVAPSTSPEEAKELIERVKLLQSLEK